MTFTGDNFNYGSQYSGGSGKYDKDDKDDDKNRKEREPLPPLRTYAPEEINPRTGEPYRGTDFVDSVKETVGSTVSSINQQIDKIETPEILKPGIDLLEGAVKLPVKTIFSSVTSGYDMLPENVKKNISTGGAALVDTLNKSTMGWSQQLDLHPALTETLFAGVEMAATAGTSKAGRQFFKEGAEFFSRKGPPTAGGLIPIPVGVNSPNANIFNGGSLLDQGNVMAIKGSSSSTKIPAKLRTARNNLDAFIKNETITDFKTQTIVIKGKEETIKVFPGTKKELTEKVQAYIRLREAAGHKQPRSGWHRLYGTLIGEDGFPITFEGGRIGSKKPLTIKSTKALFNRNIGEEVTPTGYIFKAGNEEIPIWKERPKPHMLDSKGRPIDPSNLHKHHVTHIKTTEPFGTLPDGSLRSLEQRQEVTGKLAQKGIFFGNQDYNEIYLSLPAHLGKRGDNASLAVHRTLEAVTDIQGFKDWRTQASQLFAIDPTNGKGKWYKNVKGNPPKGFEITEFKMLSKDGGHLGTYAKGQRHGFSKELMQKISNLKTTDEIVAAVETFYQKSGMVDTMQGAAAIAQYAIDGSVTGDILTTQFWKTKKPQMIEFAKVLLQDDAYKGNKMLKKIASGKF